MVLETTPLGKVLQVSKSSANPRRYSRGKDAIDATQPVYVHVEIRCDKAAVASMDERLRFLMSRWPGSEVEVVGIRREGVGVVATLGIHMGDMLSALSGTSPKLLPGYKLIWDIWVEMPEYTPVFCAPPGSADIHAAALLGFQNPDTISPRYQQGESA
jgi:hypothetical protein